MFKSLINQHQRPKRLRVVYQVKIVPLAKKIIYHNTKPILSAFLLDYIHNYSALNIVARLSTTFHRKFVLLSPLLFSPV